MENCATQRVDYKQELLVALACVCILTQILSVGQGLFFKSFTEDFMYSIFLTALYFRRSLTFLVSVRHSSGTDSGKSQK